ncbi:MAG: AAA family ATPase, partial [Gemmataceae bacterium]
RDERFSQLRTVQTRYGDELERYRNKLRKFAEGLGSGDPANLALKERYLQEQLGLAQREIYQLHTDMRRAQLDTKNYDDKVRGLGPVPDEVVLAALKDDPTYRKLAAQQAALRLSLDDVKRLTSPGARPEILVRREEQFEQATKELGTYVEQASPEIAARLKEAVLADGRRSLAASQERYVTLQNLEKAVDREIQELSEKLHTLNIDQVNLEALRAEMVQTERTAERIQQELEAMRPEFEAPARVSVWEDPTVITGIEGNRRLKYSGVSGAALLAVGLGLITLLEYRNRRVVTTRDVAENLGLRLLGTVPTIPVLPEGAARAVSGRAARWRAAVLTEYVDATRTILMHGLEPKTGRSILITSAMPGEGKTVLACHLADSLARAGYRALLVDGDLRRPTAHRMLNVPRGPGLCELLRGEVNVADVVRPAGAAGLSFLPAGEWDARVTPPLSTGRWQQLQNQLEASFDFLVIDSSPLLLVNDGLLMARHADGVVISVLRNVSQIDAVDQACDRLKALGTKLLGVVVSGVAGPAREIADSYYQPAKSPVALPPKVLIAALPTE